MANDNSKLGAFSGSSCCLSTLFFSCLTYYHRRNEGFVKTPHNKITMISLSEQSVTFCLSSSFNGLKQVKVLLRMSDSLQQLLLSDTCSSQLFFTVFKIAAHLLSAFTPVAVDKNTFLRDVELSCSAALKLMHISTKIKASLTKHFGEALHSTCLSHQRN